MTDGSLTVLYVRTCRSITRWQQWVLTLLDLCDEIMRCICMFHVCRDRGLILVCPSNVWSDCMINSTRVASRSGLFSALMYRVEHACRGCKPAISSIIFHEPYVR